MNSLQELNISPAEMTFPLVEGLLDNAVGNSTIAAPGILYAARIAPLKTPIEPARELVLADVELSDYDGAAQQAITWSAAARDENAEPYLLANRLTFVPTGDDTIGTQVITGVALIGSDSVTLFGVVNLDPPVTVNPDTPFRLDLTVTTKPPVNVL